MESNRNSFLKGIGTKLLVGNKAFIMTIILFVVLCFVSDYFLTENNLFNLLRQNSASCIIALSFAFVIALGEIDLSVGAIAGFVSVIMAMLMRDANINVFVAIVLGLIVGIICGAMNALVISALKLPAFVVTLASQSVFRGLCYILTGMKPIGPLPDEFNFIGAGYVGPIPVPVIILAAACIIMYFIADRTKFGRYAIAIGNNPESARISGINIFKVRLAVYSVVGFCATIAGIMLTGRTASAQTTTGMNMELDAIAACVIGGASLAGGKINIIGTIFGSFVIVMVMNGLNLLSVPTQYQIMAKGILILFALILDSSTSKLYEKYKKRKAASTAV